MAAIAGHIFLSSVLLLLIFSMITQRTECIQLFPQSETQKTQPIPQQEPLSFPKPVPLQQIQVPVLLPIKVSFSQEQEGRCQVPISFQI